MFKIKRIYERDEQKDGFRILVDRLWPRGLSKEEIKIDLWLKEIAPTEELRRWFNHDPAKWDEFQTRYKKELEQNKGPLDKLQQVTQKEPVITLLYGAKDELHNNAQSLLEYLKTRF